MEENQSSEGVTQPPRSAAMLSTCLSRSCVRATPATHRASYWPACASHLLLLSFPLAGDPNEAHLTGRACHARRQSGAADEAESDDSPLNLWPGADAGEPHSGELALLTVKNHIPSCLVNNTKRHFLLRGRKLTPTQVMITSPKWSLRYTNSS